MSNGNARENELTVVTSIAANDVQRVVSGGLSRNISVNSYVNVIDPLLVALGFLKNGNLPSSITNTQNVTTKTVDYIVQLTDDIILVDSTAGAVTITLPTAAAMFNVTDGISQSFTVKKIETGPFSVTVVSANTIDGAASQILSGGSRPSIKVISDGTELWLVD